MKNTKKDTDKSEDGELLAFDAERELDLVSCDFNWKLVNVGKNFFNYCPDFYYINFWCLKAYNYIFRDLISDEKAPSYYCYLLYVNYALMYYLLKRLKISGSENFIRLKAISAFEFYGFKNAALPTIYKEWLINVCKYDLGEVALVIEPYMPECDKSGDSYDSYFWSKNTAQHLPNFKLLLAITIACSGEKSKSIIDSIATLLYRMCPTLVENFAKVPGFSNEFMKHHDVTLSKLCSQALLTGNKDHVSRYFLMYGPLLQYVSSTVSEKLKYVATFVPDEVCMGTGEVQCLCMFDKSSVVPQVIGFYHIDSFKQTLVRASIEVKPKFYYFSASAICEQQLKKIFHMPLMRYVDRTSRIYQEDELHEDFKLVSLYETDCLPLK